MDLVLWIWPECRQGAGSPKSRNVCRRHFSMAPKEEETRGAKAHTALRGVRNQPHTKHCPSANMLGCFHKNHLCGWLKFLAPRLAPRVSPIHHGTKGFILKVHRSPLQLHHIHTSHLDPGKPLPRLPRTAHGEETHSWINVPLCILAARGISLFSAAYSSDSMSTHTLDACGGQVSSFQTATSRA